MDQGRLTAAANAYRESFGHPVPAAVLRHFTIRPGPLVAEIRQAIALGRAVPGWRALAQAGDLGSGPPWPPET